MIRIVSHSTIRSDFDLMQSVYRGLINSKDCRFKLFAAGAHLSPEYDTLKHVTAALGTESICTSLSLLEGRTSYAQSKSAANYLHAFVDFLHREEPDLVLVIGDREDALMSASAATYMRIPSVHVFAGDHASDGHVDNPVRHAISKLSASHFVIHEEHMQRLLAIGEARESIHVTGNPGLWKYHEAPMNQDFIRQLGLSDGRYAVVIFHPLGEEAGDYSSIMQTIVECVNKAGLIAAVGLPNTDPRLGASKLAGNLVYYGSPDTFDFVNLLRGAAVLIGNSSLGPLESASIPLNCVNVGIRQSGRLANSNVFYSSWDHHEILKALKAAIVAPVPTSNIFGDAGCERRIVDILLHKSQSLIRLKNLDPLSTLEGRPSK